MFIEQLKNFILLAEILNFRKASEQTYIAQPALSRQIQNLENELKTQLFDRSRRQIKLTLSGEYFRDEIKSVLSRLEKIKEKTELIGKG